MNGFVIFVEERDHCCPALEGNIKIIVKIPCRWVSTEFREFALLGINPIGKSQWFRND
jgi:hypothetical protein